MGILEMVLVGVVLFGIVVLLAVVCGYWALLKTVLVLILLVALFGVAVAIQRKVTRPGWWQNSRRGITISVLVFVIILIFGTIVYYIVANYSLKCDGICKKFETSAYTETPRTSATSSVVIPSRLPPETDEQLQKDMANVFVLPHPDARDSTKRDSTVTYITPPSWPMLSRLYAKPSDCMLYWMANEDIWYVVVLPDGRVIDQKPGINLVHVDFGQAPRIKVSKVGGPGTTVRLIVHNCTNKSPG